MLKWLFRVLVLLAVAGGVGSYFAASWIQTEWQLLNGREAFLRGDFEVAVETLSPAVEALEGRGFTRRSAHWRRAQARQFFLRAAQMGLARGALMMAATYDPRELTRMRSVSVQPNVAEARKWYMRAVELGASEAAHKLATLGRN